MDKVPSLDLNTYRIHSRCLYDPYNKVPDGIKDYEIMQAYDNEDNNKQQRIGHMLIRPFNGQISSIFLEKDYRGRNLGRQLLRLAYEDMCVEGSAKTMWMVTDENHSFWSSIPGMTWSGNEPVHHSLLGRGYYVNLNDPNFKSWLQKQSRNA